MLSTQKIEGLKGNLKEESTRLFEKKKNSRLFTFTHLAHLYSLGENGIRIGPNIPRKEMRLQDQLVTYNHKIENATSIDEKTKLTRKKETYQNKQQEKIDQKKKKKVFVITKPFDKNRVKTKRKKISEKYDRKIASEQKEKKRNKLKSKKAKKLDRKKKKINEGNLIMRWGEPLAIYSYTDVAASANNIQSYLYSKGYLEAEVKVDTSNSSQHTVDKPLRTVRNSISRIRGAKNRHMDIIYQVNKKSRSRIDSIQYDVKDSALLLLLNQNEDNRPLKKGFYNQEVLTQEREFVYNLALDNGYYDFSKQYISFQVDSTQLGKDTLIVREIITNPPDKKQHNVFFLDSVIFYSEHRVNSTRKRTVTNFNGITFDFGRKKYPVRILDWRILFDKGDKYSRQQTTATQKQLTLLDNFKFVNINYDTTGGRFIAKVYTSPFEKFQTSSEFGLSSTQGSHVGNPGPFINLNFKNRNTFHRLEIISLDVNAKLQDLSPVQEDDGNTNITDTYTSRQISGTISVSFPRFIFPIGSYLQNRIGKYNPQTKFSFGTIYENRISEYERLEYNSAMSYGWQVRDRIKYTITPVEVRWIDSRNTDDFQSFIDVLIAERNSYATAFRSAIVGSSSFERIENFGAYASGGAGAYLRTYFEVGGHFNSLLSASVFEDQLEEFSYIKGNIDVRKVDRLSRKTHLAYRLNLGYAYPFGENRGLPYDGYFYAGGSSSIRGWRPRRLGPGSFTTFIVDSDGNTTDEPNTEIEQPGEVLIESSIEIRHHLFRYTEGALFLDAGNVWRIENTSDDIALDDGVFKVDQFHKQIALAGGFGLRFDLQFITLRTDIGFKFIDPALSSGERFVADELFKDFRNNTQLNIGIGYPF